MSFTPIINTASDLAFDKDADLGLQLEQQADSLLAQAEAGAHQGVGSVRKAVADDVRHGKDWVRQRALSSREGLQDNPVASVAWALVAGVVLGLYLRR